MSDSLLAMIDAAATPRDFHRAAVLVQRHIRENEGPDENGVLVNTLMLKCVAMIAAPGFIDQDAIVGMSRDAMLAFHTNPPVMESAS